jgi:hypothetical protein
VLKKRFIAGERVEDKVVEAVDAVEAVEVDVVFAVVAFVVDVVVVHGVVVAAMRNLKFF